MCVCARACVRARARVCVCVCVRVCVCVCLGLLFQGILHFIQLLYTCQNTAFRKEMAENMNLQHKHQHVDDANFTTELMEPKNRKTLGTHRKGRGEKSRHS